MNNTFFVDETIHKGCKKNIPPVIEASTPDQLWITRQQLIDLYDRNLISSRTLLAAFLIDEDVEMNIVVKK